ncbi:MAG: galactose oxidase [Actinomycetota bacterium]|nr:galactose oxidase [Actinomycetota bacterium]MDQ3955400.1 galactose oxidase [Actinomycetota bacterium]
MIADVKLKSDRVQQRQTHGIGKQKPPIFRILLALSLIASVLLPQRAAQAADGAWRKLVAVGPHPSERSAPAVASLGASVYVFGGVKDDFSTQTNTFYNDLHRFATDTNTWELLSPTGGPPPARAFASAAAHEASGRILIFGGGSFGPLFVDFVAFDDLWAYSVTDNTWTQLHPANEGPEARSGTSAWLIGNRMYIFGGVTAPAFETLNDLWVYNLETNRWTELTANGAASSPPPRHVAQAGKRPVQGKLVLYGGESSLASGFRTLADTWQFDLGTNAWQDITPSAGSNIDPHRNYGAAGVIGNDMYLHGGDLPGGSMGCGAPFPQNPTEELWRFDVSRRVWTRLSPGGDPLVRLKRHAAAVVADRMYVFLGWDFKCEGTGPGQIWNLDVYSFDPAGVP